MYDSQRKCPYSLVSCLFSFLLLFQFSNPKLLTQTRRNAKALLRQNDHKRKPSPAMPVAGFSILEFVRPRHNQDDVIRKYGAGSVLRVFPIPDK